MGGVRTKCCRERCSGCQEWLLDQLLEQRWPGKVRRGGALELFLDRGSLAIVKRVRKRTKCARVPEQMFDDENRRVDTVGPGPLQRMA